MSVCTAMDFAAAKFTIARLFGFFARVSGKTGAIAKVQAFQPFPGCESRSISHIDSLSLPIRGIHPSSNQSMQAVEPQANLQLRSLS